MAKPVSLRFDRAAIDGELRGQIQSAVALGAIFSSGFCVTVLHHSAAVTIAGR